MRTRLAVFTIVAALLAMLGVMAVMADAPDAPLLQATATPTATFSFSEQCATTGQNIFAPTQSPPYKCWNPNPSNSNLIVHCCLWDDSGADVGIMFGAEIKPDVDWEVDYVTVWGGLDPGATNNAPVYLYIIESPGEGVPFTIAGQLVAQSGDIRTLFAEWSCCSPAYGFDQVRIELSPAVVLDNAKTYWFLLYSSALQSSSDYYNVGTTYDGSACGSNCTNPQPQTAWSSKKELYCAKDYGTAEWTCTYTAGPFTIRQLPIMIEGGAYVIPPTPTATPTPIPVWVSEVHGAANVSTPCVDWNSRSRCGANDDFVEVSIGNPSIATPRAINGWTLEAGACIYTFNSDNMTGPVKVIYADDMLQLTPTPTITPTRTPTPTVTPT